MFIAITLYEAWQIIRTNQPHGLFLLDTTQGITAINNLNGECKILETNSYSQAEAFLLHALL